MNISNNNLNNINISSKGNNEVKQMFGFKPNEIMRDFRKNIMQNMPNDGNFDEIKTEIKRDNEGSYYLNVSSYRNSETNEFKRSLKVSYIPKNEDFQISMNLARGNKQDILNYLGNEKNADEIEVFMKNLKQRADDKD